MVAPMSVTSVQAGPVPETRSRHRIDRRALSAICAARGITTVAGQAAALGVDRGTLYRWTVGSHTPGLDAINAAAARLDVHPSILFPTIAPEPAAKTMTEAAREIAATWPALTGTQRDELHRIFQPILLAEQVTRQSARMPVTPTRQRAA